MCYVADQEFKVKISYLGKGRGGRGVESVAAPPRLLELLRPPPPPPLQLQGTGAGTQAKGALCLLKAHLGG
jgi:hypothetical protein